MVASAPRARPPVVSIALSLVATGLDAALLALALGGLAPLAGHARALALLAVWGAGNATLAVLRPVAGHDAVATGPRERLVLVALLVLPLAVGPLGAWGERAGLAPRPGGEALGWAGVALAAAGLALRIAAMAQLGPRFSPVVALQRGHALETAGLYARVRHPGYLGALLAAAGAALAFDSVLGFAAALGMLPAFRARIRREESLLESHFGDAWRAYRARTGALWPGPGAR
uniref:Isoprenylcysteine carboxylmethyltransferase family protein n=1 Tax=Eiseniibacteriota bacterium TaxID=2212470 RepID=A0A832I1Y9_UNCEI